jgi:hypothetical protein
MAWGTHERQSWEQAIAAKQIDLLDTGQQPTAEKSETKKPIEKYTQIMK